MDTIQHDHILKKFLSFHASNPSLYNAIKKIAVESKRAGAVITMKGIFETIRAKGVSLDNDLTPMYSRLVMAREAELAGYFVIRARRS